MPHQDRAGFIALLNTLGSDSDADILAATANLQAAFERSIREKPEQWMWAHQRWG